MQSLLHAKCDGFYDKAHICFQGPQCRSEDNLPQYRRLTGSDKIFPRVGHRSKSINNAERQTCECACRGAGVYCVCSASRGRHDL